MQPSSKKIAVAAVCAALAVIMCVLTAYLPLSFMPLFIAAFCIYLCCVRGSLPYGALCALASVGLMFLMTGLSVKWFVFLIMFAPYGLLTYLIRKLGYTSVKGALIRIAIAIVYFNVTFCAVYFIAARVMNVGADGLDIVKWAAKLGGYPVLAVVATAVLVPLDAIFTGLSEVVLKRLPAARPAPPVSANEKPENTSEPKLDDVFGYEIYDNKNDSDTDK